MIYFQAFSAVALLSAVVFFFWRGRISEGVLSLFGFIGFAFSLVRPKERERKPTPLQENSRIEREIKEAKKTGDAAVLATISEPINPKTTRPKRWEDL